jgi:hypothetical protein
VEELLHLMGNETECTHARIEALILWKGDNSMFSGRFFPKFTRRLMSRYVLSVFCFFLLSSNVAAGEKTKVKALIKSVNSETEEGYILTDKGSFSLPSQSTEINMSALSYDKLINKMRLLTNKPAFIYIDNNNAVGVSSLDGRVKCLPKYSRNKKLTYKEPPLVIDTAITMLNIDTYGISITTLDGIFCVFSDYKYINYYNRIYEKLKTYFNDDNKINLRATILYHKKTESDECQGEIEDINVFE